MTVRVGVNGFGRMGRALFRASLARDLGVEVVAVNELGSLPLMAGFLARDSVYGRLGREMKIGDDEMSSTGARRLLEREGARRPALGRSGRRGRGGRDGTIPDPGKRRRPSGRRRLAGRDLGPLPGRRCHHRARCQPGPISIRPAIGWCPTRRAPPTAWRP